LIVAPLQVSIRASERSEDRRREHGRGGGRRA
jgi:hypothetical protein